MAEKRSFDFLIQWHLTERCNLRCRHCYQNDTVRGELSLAELRSALDEVVDTFHAWEDTYGVPVRPSVNVTGGEPFLRADLPAILEQISRKSYAIYVLTNGTLVDRERAVMLAGLGVRGVQVSIEGPDDIHDSIRGEGAFDRAVDGIDHLLDAGLKVTVNVTLSRLNAACMWKVVAFASHLGVQRVGFSRVVPCGRGESFAAEILGPEELRDLYCYLFSLDVRNVEIVTGDPLANQLREEISPQKGRRRRRNGEGDTAHGGCAAGVSGLTFLPDGTVVPCRRMNIPLGNVREDTIREIWALSPVLEALRTRDRYEGKCGRCERWDSCRGCRAIAFAYSKLRGREDYLADDPQCFLAQDSAGILPS